MTFANYGGDKRERKRLCHELYDSKTVNQGITRLPKEKQSKHQ